MPVLLAVWACLLAVFSPKRFLDFQERKTKVLSIPASSDENSAFTVSRAFWISLFLVLISRVSGAFTGVVYGWVFGAASSRMTTWLQAVGAALLLWGTLFVRGWDIQTYGAQTLIERVNRWIYRGLYCIGTAVLVASLTWQ